MKIKLTFLLAIVICISGTLSAQIVPAEGAILNYRKVGFVFPAASGVKEYTVEIAKEIVNTETDFETNIVSTVTGNEPKLIADVPVFGSKYTWRVIYKMKGTSSQSEFHHFATGTLPALDTERYRFRVTHKAESDNDRYVVLDGVGIVYDLAGTPVWYLPEEFREKDGSCNVNDLKLTDAGTFTFLIDGIPMEVNYDGHLIWQSEAKPETKEVRESYHHEFSRLKNGHYMSMGNYPNEVSMGNEQKASSETQVEGTDRKTETIMYGSIVEFDKMGKEVWSWNSGKFFLNNKERLGIREDGTYDPDVHLNSFYFDEKRSEIYLSFRNINAILKIRYPSGEVLNCFVAGMEGSKANGNRKAAFCNQHSCKVSDNGNFYFFNNNSCTTPSFPTLVELKKQQPGSNEVKKVWEYKCEITDPGFKATERTCFPKGGNVVKLKDGSFFASLNMPYSQVFIVKQDKQVFWSALCEENNANEGRWQPITLYRASIIESNDMLEYAIFRNLKSVTKK
jgi:hypothetical protein